MSLRNLLDFVGLHIRRTPAVAEMAHEWPLDLTSHPCKDLPTPFSVLGENPQPQHAGSQDNSNGNLVPPQLNSLHEAFKRS